MNFLLTVGPSEYKDKIIETRGFLETLGFGGQMLLQGMLTVFAVLVIIWGALVLFKLIFHDLPEKRKAKTENTNVSILCSHNFSYPFNQPIAYAQKIGELTNMLGAGHILVQRFGDILDGKHSGLGAPLEKFMVGPKADCRLEWIRQKDGGKPLSIDPSTRTVTAEGGKIKADVLNIVPPMRAANVARAFGLTNDSGFCPIDRRTFESTKIPDVYVLGDASIADAMPKSGYSANTQAKVCVRALIGKVTQTGIPEPAWSNTCYALAGDDWGLFVADTFRIVDGKIARTNTRARYQDLSASREERLVASRYLRAWMRSITADAFG